MTVTVEVVGVGEGFGGLVAPPPPHALRESNTTALASANSEDKWNRRFPNANQPNVSAKEATGKKGNFVGMEFLAVVVAAMVRVVVAALAPGVTVAGAKLQETPAGNPEHANETV